MANAIVRRCARAKASPYAPGVRVSNHSTSRIYSGKREDLIACGVAEPQWFPGEPGHRKSVSRVTMHNGQAVEIHAREKGRFGVTVYCTDEERETIMVAEEAMQRVAEAQQHADKDLSQLPTSHEQFRDLAVFEVVLKVARGIVSRQAGGFSFAPEAVGAFDSAAEELHHVVRYGTVRFSAKAKAAEIEKIKAGVARADAPLQSFLQRVATTPILPPPSS